MCTKPSALRARSTNGAATFVFLRAAFAQLGLSSLQALVLNHNKLRKLEMVSNNNAVIPLMISPLNHPAATRKTRCHTSLAGTHFPTAVSNRQGPNADLS